MSWHGSPLYLDAMQLLLRQAQLKPLARQVAAYQLTQSRLFGIFVDGRQAAILGFWPREDGGHELFFACRPLAELDAPVVTLQRAGRLIIRHWLHHHPVRRLVALVAVSHVPGQRLARLAGFCPSNEPAPAGFQWWEIT